MFVTISLYVHGVSTVKVVSEPTSSPFSSVHVYVSVSHPSFEILGVSVTSDASALQVNVPLVMASITGIS